MDGSYYISLLGATRPVHQADVENWLTIMPDDVPFRGPSLLCRCPRTLVKLLEDTHLKQWLKLEPTVRCTRWTPDESPWRDPKLPYSRTKQDQVESLVPFSF